MHGRQEIRGAFHNFSRMYADRQHICATFTLSLCRTVPILRLPAHLPNDNRCFNLVELCEHIGNTSCIHFTQFLMSYCLFVRVGFLQIYFPKQFPLIRLLLFCLTLHYLYVPLKRVYHLIKASNQGELLA